MGWRRLLLSVWASMGAAIVTAAPLPDDVSQSLARARIPLEQVSIVVQALDAPTPALAHLPGTARNPASVIKLVTTLAALERLGPAYTWRTELLADNPPQAGVIDGTSYLRGSGDPKFTHERLWLLLRMLRDRGVRELRGDLVLDRSAFAPVAAGPGDFDGKPLRPYNALPDALLFNFNALGLHLRPDESTGHVDVSIQPALDNLQIDNRLRLTGGGDCGDWRERLTALPTPVERATRLILNGDFPSVCGERDWHMQALRADDLLAGSFRTLWQELGGRFTGNVRTGTAPSHALTLAVSPAPTLAEVVRDINKFSNNVLARQLFLTLGREHKLQLGDPSPAGDSDGDMAVRDWLRAQALDLPELDLGNGSGLARQTKISAAGLTALLRHAWASAQMPEFVASLPVMAVDGTMKKRGGNGAAAGRAHIKTGSLDSVKTLAGYVLDDSGRRWSVVFLVNHANATAAQEAMDLLLARIARGDVDS